MPAVSYLRYRVVERSSIAVLERQGDSVVVWAIVEEQQCGARAHSPCHNRHFVHA